MTFDRRTPAPSRHGYTGRMNATTEDAGAATLSPRVALLSILGFWTFYFAIVTVRSTVLEMGDQWDMLGRRLIVTVASAAATLLLYLVLRRIPRRSLGLSVAIAAVLAVPAAVLYSTANFLAFRAVTEREEAAKARKTTKMVVIDAPRGTAPAAPPPPPRPGGAGGARAARRSRPRRAISVHVEDADGRRSEPVVTVDTRANPRLPDIEAIVASASRDAGAAIREARRAAARGLDDADDSVADATDAAEAVQDAVAAIAEARRAQAGVTAAGGSEAAAEAAEAVAAARAEAVVAAREARRAAAAARAAAAVPLPPVTLDANRRIMVQVGGGSDGHSMTPIQAIADNAANGYFFIAAWAALYLAMCYAAETRVAERRAARFRAAAQSAELRALRYQVNPHFLFNTLNSLSSLVMIGKAEAAERMIMNLSTFFRTSLTGDPTDDMRLDEEIRLQRLYLDIEAVRFPERLVVDIAVPPELENACVPGLILQPLVENAVKYGVSRARRPITIRIRAKEQGSVLRLTVEDDGDTMLPDEDAPPGTGVGLRNVRDRLAARYGEACACDWGPLPGGGFGVTLLLPLVRRDC